MEKSRTPPWRKENPRKKSGGGSRKLSPAQREKARERASRAGRHYPNLVDNMWASTNVSVDGEVRQKAGRAKKPATKNAVPKDGAKKKHKGKRQSKKRKKT